LNSNDRQRIEPEFNRALQLRDADDWDGARTILERLAQEFPNYPAVLGTLASIHFHLCEYKKALPLFERTVARSPQSELASLGLAHCLLETNQRAEAVAELRRYLALRDSQEHRALLTMVSATIDDSAAGLTG
jgi:predicted Zn-dependent protease